MFKKISNFTLTLVTILILFICIFFIPLLSTPNINIDNLITENFSSSFIWPVPGYTRITSPFGSRTSPTTGASSYHTGIDISVPEGTPLLAINNGQITFTGFLGAGGYTITLTSSNMKITYCHVSPNYIVSEGDFIFQGQILGHVGPKYVENVPGNRYFDEYR